MIKLRYPKFWDKSGIIAFCLLPLSWLYLLAGFIRKKWIKPVRLPARVICIGNINIGGTGKTQLVEWIADIFKKQNINFVMITKGYGGRIKYGAKLVTSQDDACLVGDESVLLASSGSVIAAGKISAAIPLINSLKPEIIILDDGMQNPELIKDLTILTIDIQRGLGNNYIFPAGPLRETLAAGLQKADLICVLGSRGTIESGAKTPLMKLLHQSRKPLFTANTELQNKLDTAKNYYAFTGIGNPEKFYTLLKENNCKLVKTTSYPDHHLYTLQEIKQLKNIAADNNYLLVTTKKDYVKITDKDKIICAEVRLFFAKELELIELIYAKIR